MWPYDSKKDNQVRDKYILGSQVKCNDNFKSEVPSSLPSGNANLDCRKLLPRLYMQSHNTMDHSWTQLAAVNCSLPFVRKTFQATQDVLAAAKRGAKTSVSSSIQVPHILFIPTVFCFFSTVAPALPQFTTFFSNEFELSAVARYFRTQTLVLYCSCPKFFFHTIVSLMGLTSYLYYTWKCSA